MQNSFCKTRISGIAGGSNIAIVDIVVNAAINMITQNSIHSKTPRRNKKSLVHQQKHVSSRWDVYYIVFYFLFWVCVI